MRILVVDDDLVLARAAARILLVAGHEVVTASCARDAIAAFERFRPEVVLCDLDLPDLSGRELLVVFRETGWSHAHILTTGEPVEADEFPVLTKPWTIEELHRLLAAVSPIQLVTSGDPVRRMPRGTAPR